MNFSARIMSWIGMLMFMFVCTLALFPHKVDAAQQQGTRLAVIDMQKVMRESRAGKTAMEKLNKKFEKLREELKKKQEELKAFKEDLEKKAPLLNEDARAEKERQYKKMLREFKDQSDDAQFEMRQLESRTMEPILKELEKVVTKIGKEKGYTIILENKMPGLYYVRPDVDITDDVIRAYDAMKSKQEKGAK